MKKIFVLDTNVLLTDPNSLFSYQNNDIVIPIRVLDEIDGKKKRQDSVGLNARVVIRTLDKLRASGNLYEGVKLRKGLGKLFVRYHDISLIQALDNQSSDNVIISTALAVQNEFPKRKVILVTEDINMRVKCDAHFLSSIEHKKEKVVEDRKELYTGTQECLVDPQDIDAFHKGQAIVLKDVKGLCPNQFLMLISTHDNKRTALARFQGEGKPLKKVVEHKTKNTSVMGLNPRNKEQMYALNLLMDPDVPLVSLTGKSGSGKTLLAIAAGLQQVINHREYGKLIVSRPVMPVGKDIGFLPGSMNEKLSPWLAPIKDNLEFLGQLNSEEISMDKCLREGTIEMEAVSYIRGRSITNAFMIIDEVQNSTPHEIKTILTRVGNGTKIVLLGDCEQIDTLYMDEISNGLTYAVEKFKNYELSGHVTLTRGERSEIATLASKIL